MSKIPIRTLNALQRFVGLTKEQAEEAWEIIIDHLGIASPPTSNTKKSKFKTNPKCKTPLADDENFWLKYDEYKTSYVDPYTEEEESKPKHAIEVTDMINDEIKRLQTEPEPTTTETKSNNEKRIVRKNKSGQW